jgi:hypothetical protein
MAQRITNLITHIIFSTNGVAQRVSIALSGLGSIFNLYLGLAPQAKGISPFQGFLDTL